MITVTYKHKRLKIDLRRLFVSTITIILTITFLRGTIDFMRYPDKYITIWKYQLQNEINAGDAESIEYYQTNYIDKGVCLFGEK